MRLLRALLLVLLLIGYGESLRAQAIQVDLVEPSLLVRDMQQFPRENADRQAHMVQLFQRAGCPAVQLLPLRKNGASANVVCRWPGKRPETIVVGAHFDKVKAGDGVIDNATGSVVLVHLMKTLQQQPREYTYLYVAFAEEEAGLLGSKALVKSGLPDQEGKAFLATLRAMVNLDSLGLSSPAIALSASDPYLAAVAGAIAKALKQPLRFVNVDQVGQSDGSSFRQKGIPSIEFHSLDQQTWPILHSDRDTLAELKEGELFDSYRLLAFYLVRLDVVLDERQSWLDRKKK